MSENLIIRLRSIHTPQIYCKLKSGQILDASVPCFKVLLTAFHLLHSNRSVGTLAKCLCDYSAEVRIREYEQRFPAAGPAAMGCLPVRQESPKRK